MIDPSKVLETMQQSDEPMKTGEIAQILGVDSKEVSKAIKQLKADEKIESPKRCYYQPKRG
jgi:Mn-dependent DtxR family transcriptional regulator